MKPTYHTPLHNLITFTAVAALGVAGSACAADFTWGGGTLDWTDITATGWNGGPPTTNDNAAIGSGIVTVTTEVGNLNSLTLSGTSVLEITTGELFNDGWIQGRIVTLGSGTTLRVKDWNYNTPGSLGELSFERDWLIVNGATIEYTGNSNVPDGQAGRNFTVGVGSEAGGGGATLKTMTAGQTWTIAARWEDGLTVIENSSYQGLTLGGVGNGVIDKPIDGWGNLNKTDSGTWTLTGASTNYGNVTVSGGKLAVTGAGKLYSNFAWGSWSEPRVVTIESGGTLEVDRWGGGGALGEFEYSTSAIVINNGTIRFTGTSNGTVDGPGFTIGAGGATLESTAPAGNAWNINLDERYDFFITSAAAGTLTLTGTGDGTITKIIPGAGALTKTGGGTWALSASNTYTGPTAINSGTLVITGATQDTSAITFGGGVLGLNIASEVTAAGASVDFTGQAVLVTGTPTAASYTLLTASSITGTPTLAAPAPAGYQLVNEDNSLKLVSTGSAYTLWAATNAPTGNPDDDFDGDGVSNAVEFVLGGLAITNDLEKLPTASSLGGNMIFTFKRDQDSIDPKTALSIEVSTDLATWNTLPSPYTVPDGATTGPPVNVVNNGDGTDSVTLTLTQAPDAKKFARLRVVITE